MMGVRNKKEKIYMSRRSCNNYISIIKPISTSHLSKQRQSGGKRFRSAHFYILYSVGRELNIKKKSFSSIVHSDRHRSIVTSVIKIRFIVLVVGARPFK